MKEYLSKYKFLFVSLTLFIFLRLPTLFEPYWYGDEGIYLVLGQAIRRGLTLYSQIHDNKPPTLYYLAALSHTVFGFRLLLLIWMIPTLYFYYQLTKKFLSGLPLYIAFFLFLILTSIPFLEGTIANAEVFMLLPTIVAFYIGYSAKKSDLISWLFIGLLLGFAFTIKVPVAFECAFLFLWLLLHQIKNLKPLFLSLGFVIPTVLCAIYFAIHGALWPFLSAALLQNIGYLSSWTTGNHASSASSGGLTTRLLILFATWIFLTYIFIKKKISSELHFLLCWFAVTVFASLLSGRPYPHYLIQILPPLCLLLGYLFIKTKAKLIIIFSLFAFILITIKFNFYYYPVFSYYQNFYSYLLNQKSVDSYRSFFGNQVNQIYHLSDFIKKNTPTSEKIFIWGDAPMLYALSQRLPVGRFTVAYHILDFNAYDESITKLQANLPRYIIVYPMPNRHFLRLDNFLHNYYYLDQFFQNGVMVYSRRL